jgi:hypothetical protein
MPSDCFLRHAAEEWYLVEECASLSALWIKIPACGGMTFESEITLKSEMPFKKTGWQSESQE